MKTLNIKSNNTKSFPSKFDDDLFEKQPCWFTYIEKADNLNDYTFRVGCEHNGQVSEYSFKGIKVKNITKALSDIYFSIRLIYEYKQGGDDAVRKWIKNGCPY